MTRKSSATARCSDNLERSTTTQQIYAVVLNIQSSLKGPDVRWSHFQQPLLIEDALGRKYPVPSEGDFGMLKAILEHKFKDGPGAEHVRVGNYELCRSSRRSEVLDPATRLLPGTAILMAIILTAPTVRMNTTTCCPMPQCQSTEATPCLKGDGLIW